MDPYVQYMYSYPHKTAYGPLTGISLKDYGAQLAGPGHSLYLHIPFCQTKCGYCDLFSVTGQGSREIDRYLDAVKRQILQYRSVLGPVRTSFSDLTIGGGTPLLLSELQLDRIFSMVFGELAFDEEKTVVIETAPAQTTKGKLAILKEAGVTRVSIGVQSFFDGELRTLKRQHGAGCARKALELLMAAAFPCVNIDLIYGIPGQTTESLLASVEEAVSFGADEIFLYPLYVKHGASLERALGKGLRLDPKKALLQYREGAAFLRAQGFRQDSMRRFVRTGDGHQEPVDERPFSECGFGTSLALGCGGRSYLGRLHFCTPYRIARQDCLEQLGSYEATEDYLQIRHGIWLSKEEEKRRYVIRHLFIRPGLPMERYQACFGSQVLADLPVLERWIREGYLVLRGEAFLSMTEEGLALSDYLGPQLISPAIRRRMEEWEEENRPAGGLQRRS